MKAFNREGKTEGSQHNARSNKIRTPRFVNGLKRSIKANPTMPISKLAKNRGMSNLTIRKAIKDSLGYMSRARDVKHLLTYKNKADRVAEGKKIIYAIKTIYALLLR